MTSVDLAALTAAQGVSVPLFGGRLPSPTGSSDPLSGFDTAGSLYVILHAVPRSKQAGVTPSLVVTVEHSDDGISWSTAAEPDDPFTGAEGEDGIALLTIDTPKNYVRLSWVASGSAWLLSATAKPGLAAASGSLPAFAPSVGALWTFDPATGKLTISSSVVDLSLLVIEAADIAYEFTDDGIVISGKDGASGAVTVKDTPVIDGGSNGGTAILDGVAGLQFSDYGATDPIIEANGGGFTANFRGDTTVRLLTSSGGVRFPTVDPHIAGAWWDNAGTLTKSAG